MYPIITLTTDFGEQDSYVGQMKGAILSVQPRVQLVDLNHQIPPQRIVAGAFELWRAWRAFPLHTVHVAVVDPGVGTARRIIAAHIKGHFFVLPDNGLLSFILAEESVEEVVEVADPRFWRSTVSHTFHGRDIMGPVAAHIASGVPLRKLGGELDAADLVMLESRLQDGDRRDRPFRCEVLHVDRFGNVVLPVRGELSGGGRTIHVSIDGTSLALPAARCYGEVPNGALVLITGSSGLWEIAKAGGSAAEHLGVEVGSEVELDTGR
ncbi:MAG: hypothetical protein KatS3mg111_1557 [Pirellulaceae bacterium]|nr:MAG: hypothetical protein KatS3mg111_1557 [Pirellulaceae bacterium]